MAEDQPEWRHATALIGAPRNARGFRHYKYVNVNAPKGGAARLSDNGTFDSLNVVIAKGTTPLGMGLIYDSLMTSSLDEVSTMYGLVAEALRYPEDYSWVSFRLREGARWHDGKPITVEDVIWSFEKLTRLNPQQGFYYRHVKEAKKTGDREVTFTFKVKGNRELPHIVGQLMILPRHWWEGTGKDGKKRDIASGTLEPPLGSGPYRVKTVVAGRSIAYERVKDYWARDLNVNVGQNNFDEIRYEYYRDGVVQLEAFKADEYDWREENTAKNWATAYDIPAARDGRIIKALFPERGRGLMVGFIFNLRRKKFADPRLRQAFNYAFDFEEMNRTIFFGQYKRLGSYFSGTELASKGLPEGRELEILESVRGEVPPQVFTTVYKNPVSRNRRERRANLRKAIRLLKEAGWIIRGGRLVNATTGKPFEIEYLLNGPAFERVALRFKNSLRPLGINLRIRTVDSSQYIARIRSRDYDMIYTGWGQSLSPGNELQGYFSSIAADRAGSRNYAGLKNKAVDKLVQRVIFARDREELIAASRALDRVLLWTRMLVPGWGLQATRVARWNRFSHPEKLPRYSHGFPTVWWYDKAKAARTGARK
jgi:microcin C transport system substrate-binding protein